MVTAQEDGSAELTDERLLERASELGRVLFSHDRDFLTITDHWLEIGREFAGLAYGHQQRISYAQAINDLELIAKASDPLDARNKVFYIPFK